MDKKSSLEELITEFITEIAQKAVREEFARILLNNATKMDEKKEKENDNLLGGIPAMAKATGIPYYRMRSLVQSGNLDDVIKRGGGNSKIWVMKSDLLKKIKELKKI